MGGLPTGCTQSRPRFRHQNLAEALYTVNSGLTLLRMSRAMARRGTSVAWGVGSMRLLGVLRQVPSADARIQLIEDHVQPTLAGLTSGHLEQDLARFRGGVLDCPADLAVGDHWIAIVIEFKASAA